MNEVFVATVYPLDPLLDTVTATVATFTLPAGKYVIHAPIRFRTQRIEGGAASVWCELYAGGWQLDSYLLQYRVGEDYQDKVAPLLGTRELTTPASVEVRCRANYDPSVPAGFSDIGVVEGPIVATRVRTITSV